MDFYLVLHQLQLKRTTNATVRLVGAEGVGREGGCSVFFFFFLGKEGSKRLRHARLSAAPAEQLEDHR